MVKGNKVVYEHVEEGVTSDGGEWEIPVICVYEFNGEKIQHHRAVYDRLPIAKQAAKGWGPVAQRVVNSFVKRWEKGLH